ncbi:hypothetical protein B0H11DRAFT_2237742 [Mycena galericulata]|nr:hypothetical protein B0H11DRAFT_2237742 [Mycena galericulata]
MAKQNSAAHLEFIDGLPTRDIKAFRDYLFTKPYITTNPKANPHLFADTARSMSRRHYGHFWRTGTP